MGPSLRHRRRWVPFGIAAHLVALGLLVFAMGCTSPGQASTPAEPTAPAAPEASAEPAPADEAAAVPAADERPAAPPAAAPTEEALAQAEGRYFGLRFEIMPEEMRTRFIELAEGELCPCDGQVASLDDCLKTEQSTCELAVQSAALMMELIAMEADTVQITDAVQGFVRNARAVHTFTLDGVPYQGAEEPELVIVEFYDFECPHCKFLSEAWPTLLEEFGDRIRVYHKQFPLQSHPNAAAASAAALAAHAQGAYFPFHELVFANQSRLQQASNPLPLFDAWAEELGLNLQRFAQDRVAAETAAAIARDRQEGMTAGIMGTPALYFDGVMWMGASDLPTLQAELRRRLGSAAR